MCVCSLYTKSLSPKGTTRHLTRHDYTRDKDRRQECHRRAKYGTLQQRRWRQKKREKTVSRARVKIRLINYCFLQVRRRPICIRLYITIERILCVYKFFHAVSVIIIITQVSGARAPGGRLRSTRQDNRSPPGFHGGQARVQKFKTQQHGGGR